MKLNQQESNVIINIDLTKPVEEFWSTNSINYLDIMRSMWLDSLWNGSETISTDHDQYAYDF